ncbi:uncharacterized protein LOC126978696 [Leptidea sinapis]|nr:uncharacterized protein LOC126974383 [Leptidea sinapis]XP_050683666.1 uncharacterized protein LOC126978696 [Leptidea sinapis]
MGSDCVPAAAAPTAILIATFERNSCAYLYEKMNDEKLIILVSKYECLFDITKPSYSDRIMKDNAWEEISKCLGISVTQCQDRWKKLRDNFRKAYYNRKGKSGDGATTSKLIKFEKELSFIIPFFRNRNQISNVTLSSDDSEPGTPIPPPSTSSKRSDHSEVESLASTSGSKKRPRLSKDVATVFEEYLEEKRNTTPRDKALRNFFLSMSDTVETFPKEVQARIKRRVFNIVNEAELSLYENSTDLNYSLSINSPPSTNQSTYLVSNETYIPQNYPDQTTYGYNTSTQNTK